MGFRVDMERRARDLKDGAKRPLKAPTPEQYSAVVKEYRTLTWSPISPCGHCGWPVVRELACNFCESTKP